METLGQRIRALRKAMGLSQQQLGDSLGWGDTRLSMYERDQRTPKIQQLRELAQKLGVTLEDLISQEQLIDNGKHIVHEASVPLISWVQAGTWAAIEDHYHPGESDEWVPTTLKGLSKHAFALRVEGDSMTAQSGNITFPDGCVILVDPERAPKSGDFVVAKDVSTQKATFKKLTTDGSRWYLKPLNPSYPAIEIDDPAMRVIGVAVEWQMAGKL